MKNKKQYVMGFFILGFIFFGCASKDNPKEWARELELLGIPVPQEYLTLTKNKYDHATKYIFELPEKDIYSWEKLSNQYYNDTKAKGWEWRNPIIEKYFLNPESPQPPSMVIKNNEYLATVAFIALNTEPGTLVSQLIITLEK